jgi:hypothetical protein
MMTSYIINPGTGPCERPLLVNAWSAIRRFRRDLFDASLRTRHDLPLALTEPITIERAAAQDDHERGYYGFRLQHPRRKIDVDIPGIPLIQLRYLGLPEQNAWHFQRLYVDGNSWLWEFAISITREALR